MASVVFFYSAERAEGEYIPSHAHSCWEIVFYRDNAGKTEIDGKSWYFGKNMFAVLPPKCPHSEHHSKRGKLTFLGFQDSDFSMPAGVYRDDAEQTVRRTMDRIFEEIRNRYNGSDRMLALLLDELKLLLLRTQAPGTPHPNDIGYAKAFIEENYHWKIRFPELARNCGYSFDLFRRKFKETYGISPKNYLIGLRLERAREMLLSTDLSCTEIAYECGFSDSAQFSTMYRARFGASPRQSKEQTRAKRKKTPKKEKTE